MIKKDTFQKLKCRRVYQFYLDEETGEITDITSHDDYVQVIRCKDCALWDDADSDHLVGYCAEGDGEKITFRNEWCCWAERKEE